MRYTVIDSKSSSLKYREVYVAYRIVRLTLVFMLGGTLELQAYTDPGTGALLWQLVVAGFVGGIFYVRRLTSLLKRNKH
jgi:hypothetical protein